MDVLKQVNFNRQQTANIFFKKQKHRDLSLCNYNDITLHKYFTGFSENLQNK